MEFLKKIDEDKVYYSVNTANPLSLSNKSKYEVSKLKDIYMPADQYMNLMEEFFYNTLLGAIKKDVLMSSEFTMFGFCFSISLLADCDFSDSSIDKLKNVKYIDDLVIINTCLASVCNEDVDDSYTEHIHQDTLVSYSDLLEKLKENNYDIDASSFKDLKTAIKDQILGKTIQEIKTPTSIVYLSPMSKRPNNYKVYEKV